MSVEVEAVPPAKLPVFDTIAEGLIILRSNAAIFAMQLLAVLIVAVALDLVPALVFGTDSLIWPHPATFDMSTATLVSVWVIRIAVTFFLLISLMFGVARAVLLKKRPTVIDLIRAGPHRMQEICASIVLLFAILMGGHLMRATAGSGWPLSSWMDLVLQHPVAAVVAIFVARWVLLEIPAIAINDDMFEASRIAEGNVLRLLGITLCIFAGTIAALILAEWFLSLVGGDSLSMSTAGFLVDLLIVIMFLIAFSAIGAAAYRRLITMKPKAVSTASTDQA